ncbi:hypothetical protein NL528_09040 [Bradyrhizobium sp. Ash2021]|nr:hypothetical protein [Bradyrhizobium sp. Ash2021]WMT76487.1 hypothetical protein NL528_09040 [Bradyrhizobium sp. Ash2021]
MKINTDRWKTDAEQGGSNRLLREIASHISERSDVLNLKGSPQFLHGLFKGTDVIEQDGLQHRTLKERRRFDRPALRLRNTGSLESAGQPVVGGSEIASRSIRDGRREAPRFGSQNPTQTHSFAALQGREKDRPHRIDLGREAPLVVRRAEHGKKPLLITRDHRTTQLCLGRKVIMDACALDPDIAGDLTKAAGVKTARAHALFGRIQNCFADVHLYLSSDR